MTDTYKKFLAQLEEAKVKVAKYAYWRVNSLAWNTVEDLPKGKTVEDLVSEAIEKTLRGIVTDETGDGVRKWDPNRCDLLTFLKGVVDSDISNLINSSEHEANRYGLENDEVERDDPLEAMVDTSGLALDGTRLEASTPEAEVLGKEDRKQNLKRFMELMTALLEECEDDSEETAVLTAISELGKEGEEITAKVIADLTGFDEDKVKSARRRIARKVEKVKLEHKKKGRKR